MNTKNTILSLIDDCKNDSINKDEATTEIIHACIFAAHQKIIHLEASEEHKNGSKISDLFESEILLPLAFQLE